MCCGRRNFTRLFIGTGVSRKLLNFKHIGEIFIFNLKKNRFFSLKLHLNPVHDFGLQFLIVCVCVRNHLCVRWSLLCQAARQPGSQAAGQPGSGDATLCGQGTVCPLSCCFEFTTNLTAASSLIHCSRWRRACCSRVFAHFFWRGSCGKQSLAHCCVQLYVQATKRGGGNN